MEIEIAKSAIDKHIRNSGEHEEIEIDLFGGEPFLRPDFIQDLCHWTWKQKYDKPIIFFATTNGTMIHGEIQNWLKKYSRHICVGLSLDGTPNTHNTNRSDSYNSIDTKFFLDTYPYQPVRMTITSDFLNNLAEDIIYLHNLGFEISATLAHGIEWDIEKNKKQLSDELNKLCEYYLANPQVHTCSLFNMFLPVIPNKIEQKKWCGSGEHIVAINIDGNEYPCVSFLPNTMTNLSWQNIDFKSITDFSDIECHDCLIKNICPTCYGMNFMRDGSLVKRDKNLCELYKILALANSYLLGIQIEQGLVDFEQKKILVDAIRAIKLIQNNISIS